MVKCMQHIGTFLHQGDWHLVGRNVPDVWPLVNPSSENLFLKVYISRRRTKTWDDSQPDSFIALPSDIPTRDQQDLMERPFFSLSKNKRTTPIEYEVGRNYICVTAPEKYGMATIWDADILIWAASQITEARERGLKTSRFFQLSAYDLLKFIHRGTSGRDYQELKAALDRLQSTTVVTSIRQARLRLDGLSRVCHHTQGFQAFMRSLSMHFVSSLLGKAS